MSNNIEQDVKALQHALNIADKAGWDPSWAANNGEDVEAAQEFLTNHVRVYRRLREQVAAAHPVIDALANAQATRYWPSLEKHVCIFCSAEQVNLLDFPHTPDCPVTMARAFMVQYPE